jgi:2Fe-2S ferredoxin
MPQLFFISPEGERHEVTGRLGDSVMDAGVRNVVPGMFGLCGGALACVTCHVYVDESTVPLCGEPGDFELEMLDGTMSERRENSRLGCQIPITEELDGGTFIVPEKNY